MKKTSCPQVNRGFKFIVALILLLVVSGALVLFLPVGTESRAIIVSAVYAVLVTVFLIAQFWGFIVAQTEYSESIEEPKFAMLTNEMKEWKR